jgi:very-long-chain enoyl-CoA reductase
MSSSDSVTLVIQPRGKPIRQLPQEVNVNANNSTAALYAQISAQTNLSVHRLRITKGSDNTVVPPSGSTISATGLRNKSTIAVKDLGPQLAWTTVFVIEYLGPILIHPLIYLLRPWLYSGTKGTSPSDLQKLSMALVLLHFVKREFETLFIHRFSLSTMPFSNIFKNSAHYWLLAGLNIAYWTYGPAAPAANGATDSILTLAGLALFVVGELGNLNAHLTLRSLRAEGTTTRGIPVGLGFGLVTCPNYMFEIIAWTGMWMVNRSWSTALFALVGGAQMAVWAKKKERRYRKEFGDKYKRKQFSMIPGVI